MTKQDLRKRARQMRKDFVARRGSPLFPVAAPSMAAFDALLASARCLAGYVAMHSEADPSALLMHAATRNVPLALPWIGDAGNEMLFRAWRPADPLHLCTTGFEQPLPHAPVVTPDIILLPLLGFDRAGNRLGQGAGHYDRALAKQDHALRIGLAWSVQAFDALPADPWDMPLDAILTEAEWILPPLSRIGH